MIYKSLIALLVLYVGAESLSLHYNYDPRTGDWLKLYLLAWTGTGGSFNPEVENLAPIKSLNPNVIGEKGIWKDENGIHSNRVDPVSVEDLDYTYDALAGGWLKLYKPASWTTALQQCQSEGAILASPVNSQLRNAIRKLVKKEGVSFSTILSGVHADSEKGGYYSQEGVSLTTMPVLVESTLDHKSEESCVNWNTFQDKVFVTKCSVESPFVCFKKTKTLVVAGCGTTDPNYTYEMRTGSCYKFQRKGDSWENAFAQCKKENAYLTVINSPLEHKVLLEIYDKNPSSTIVSFYNAAIIGFRKNLQDNTWKTVDGQSLADAGFEVWDAGEPNNELGIEACGSLNRNRNFNDIPCNNNYNYPYICEKNPEIIYT